MKTLLDLYENICNVAMDKPKGEDWYRVWFKLMSIYPFVVVKKAWESIVGDPELKKWDYFSTNVWVKKCDYCYDRHKQAEEQAKPKEPFKAESLVELRAWAKKFFSTPMTRETFLTEGRAHGIFNSSPGDSRWSLEKFVEYYAKWGHKLDKPVGHGNTIGNINLTDMEG